MAEVIKFDVREQDIDLCDVSGLSVGQLVKYQKYVIEESTELIDLFDNLMTDKNLVTHHEWASMLNKTISSEIFLKKVVYEGIIFFVTKKGLEDVVKHIENKKDRNPFLLDPLYMRWFGMLTANFEMFKSFQSIFLKQKLELVELYIDLSEKLQDKQKVAYFKQIKRLNS